MKLKVLSLICVGLLAMASSASAQPEPPESKYDDLPWTMDEVREAYAEGFALVYTRSGVDEDGEEVGGTQSFEVVEADEWSVQIDDVWQQGGERHIGNDRFNWQDAVFLGSFPASSDTEFRVTGEETVTVPAGTFESVVVEVTNEYFKTRDTYWLVKDQPGVYAKWVGQGQEGSSKKIVNDLTEVRSP